MSRRLNRRLLAALALLPAFAFARAARAADTDCLATESKKNRIPWVHSELPDRKQLPPLPAVQAAGAFVLLDEVMYRVDERVYSFMAMLGGNDSVRELGDVQFDTGLGQYAEILARVQNPDGTVTQVADEDIHCSVVRFSYQGNVMGKAYSPKIYSFRFPHLQPGSLVQYQISLRYHAGESSALVTGEDETPDLQGFGSKAPSGSTTRQTTQSSTVDPSGRRRITTTLGNEPYIITLPLLGDQYSAAFATREGAQRRILGETATRYPAANISYLFSIPKSGKFEAKQIAPGGRYSVVDLPSKDGFTEKLTAIQTNRPGMPHEPWEPDYRYASPLIATVARAFSSTPITRPWTGYADWGEWLTRNEADYMVRLRDDSAAFSALAAEQPAVAAAGNPGAQADAAARHLRDRVANAQGSEVRTTGSLRPPIEVLTKSRTGWPIEKALALVSVLRSQHLAAQLVYVRLPSATPIDRSLPMSGWFDYGRFLVAADVPGTGRRYYDPVSRVAAGKLPARVQAGEALIVSDRKTFEWATLPVSAESDNLTRTELRVESAESGTLKGTFRVEITGRAAEPFRAAREMAPEEFLRGVQVDLRGGCLPGALFSAVAVENRDDPDLPLVITGRFEAGGAVNPLGAKRLVTPLVLRRGPVGATFAAEQRTQEVDFHIPERYELEVQLPASLGKVSPAEPVAFSGPGGDYRYEIAAGESGARISRTLRLHDRVPVARYGELKAFMQKVEAQDLAGVAVGP